MVVVLLILLHIFQVHVIVTTTGGIEEDLIKGISLCLELIFAQKD
jgi:deoxyhypusine synthase